MIDKPLSSEPRFRTSGAPLCSFHEIGLLQAAFPAEPRLMRRFIGIVRIVTAAVYTVVVAIITILSHPFDQRRGRIYHALGRFWSRGVLWICGLPLRVGGAEQLERGRTYVFVSNHASLFDIPSVIAGAPGNVRIVYKKELERIPIFGWCLNRGNRADAMRSVEEAARKIREGDSVLLFAEGTRTLDGKLQSFKRGAFNLAVRSGVPVVPLTINGTFSILRKGSIAINSGPVEIVLGSPIVVDPSGGKEEEFRVMEAVHAAIAAQYRDQS
jgi:1-acyl-sn-glycerol-3-phosphate acyltransferase